MADVIILGGGIQGLSMALAAVERGLHPVLIERNGIGGGASSNSYGIVHGGLRYLQTLSLARWHRSRRAQHWYANRFPDQIRPLRCVMPLYAGKARSPALFAAARRVEDAMTALLQAPPAPAPAGSLPPNVVRDLFPVPQAGLIGAAYWYDLELRDAGTLLARMAERAKAGGATVLLHHDAESLLLDCGVRGLVLHDRKTNRRRSLHADVIIDCRGANAGYWSGSSARGVPAPTSATLAYNLLLDMPPPPQGNAIAVSCVPGTGRSYFLRAQRGQLLAGTFYRPAPGSREPNVTGTDIDRALDELQRCLPALSFGRHLVKAVTAGLLPDRDGTGQQMVSNDRHLMPVGAGYHILLSSKLTTAPLASERLAARLWPTPRRLTQQIGALQNA